MTCKGDCENELWREKQDTSILYISHYSKGYRLCMECSIGLKTTATRCPCCNTRLRTSPRSHKNKGVKAY